MIANVLTKPLVNDRDHILKTAMGSEAFDYSQSENIDGRILDYL